MFGGLPVADLPTNRLLRLKHVVVDTGTELIFPTHISVRVHAYFLAATPSRRLYVLSLLLSSEPYDQQENRQHGTRGVLRDFPIYSVLQYSALLLYNLAQHQHSILTSPLLIV